MKSNKNIHISKCEKELRATGDSLHTHDFIEIVYVLSGEMVHEIDGCSYWKALWSVIVPLLLPGIAGLMSNFA